MPTNAVATPGVERDKLERTLSVRLQASESIVNQLRQVAGQLSLQHRSAAYDGDVQRLSRFEQSHGFFADRLIGAREGLAHAEIERQLDCFEMVIFAAGFSAKPTTCASAR